MIFAHQVVLITGGASGIGFSTAAYFLERGAKVAIADNNKNQLEQAVQALEQYGGSLLGIHNTIATPEGAQDIIDQVLLHYKDLNVLINNAALVKDNLLLRMTIAEFDEVIATNLSGTFYCTRAAVSHMVSNKSGRIINLIAASGLAGNVGQTNYSASKGGIMGMTLTWSKELARHNIYVNAVIPAAWTEMSERIPKEVLLKMLGEERLVKMQARKPEQVAPLLGFLASSYSEGVTGQCLSIAGERLSVWHYGKPFIEFTAKEDCWTLETIAERLTDGDYWQQPADSLL